MPPHMDNLVFLTYLPRSGSTYLAELLDALPGVGVSLSGKFPEGVRVPLPDIHGPEDISALVQEMLDNPNFAGWGLGREELTSVLQGLGLPLDPAELLPALLRAHFAHRGLSPEVPVYKNNQYIRHVKRLRSLFPGCRFLFLMRDPRAVFSSTLRNKDLRTGRPMNTDPVVAALDFNRIAPIVLRHEHEPWFHWLRFEDLLTDPHNALSSLAEFLGVPCRETAPGEYGKLIPKDQEELHGNVGKPPQTERIKAWRQEVEAADLRIIQALCGRNMQRFGYDTEPVPMGFRQWMRLAGHAPRLVRAMTVQMKRAIKALARGRS